MKKIIIALMILLFTTSAIAVDLYDPQTGKYLGQLGGSRYDPDSTSNPYGQYGSKYSSDSINNPYGEYGSRYSNESANNPYATQAPIIVNPTRRY